MSKSVPLYIHIPFCISKCTYCDFFSIPRKNKAEIDSYIESILKEAEYKSKAYDISSWKSIYIGGGTPSVLDSNQFKMIFTCLRKIASVEKDAEITVEVNASDVTKELLNCLFENGVTRLSCGIQSLNDESLKAVKRRSTQKENLFALECISKYWKGDFSADIISGLPFETKKSFLEGLNTLLSFSPCHVSLYALTIEEGTALHKDIIDGRFFYDYDKADEMWLSGRDFLLSNKYEHYEVSNFCIPNKQSQHNLSYWKLEDYAGIGTASVSTFYSSDNFSNHKEKGWRVTNTKNISNYIKFWKDYDNNNTSLKPEVDTKIIEEITRQKIATFEEITKEIESFEFFMMGFRTLQGVSSSEYEKRFGPFPKKVKDILVDWEKCGKAKITNQNNEFIYALTEQGILFLNSLLQQIL